MVNRTSILYSLALVLCLFAQVSLQATWPKSVINEMATRQQRYHHYLWHQVREGWNRFPESTKQAYRDIGWTPPRPARTYDSSGTASAILDNNSGEDFLYMHRTMIATVNDIIAKNKDPYGKIQGWTTIPAPGDKTWPVPSAYTIPGNSGTTSSLKTWKSDSFYKNSIQSAEKTFKDPAQLRKMSLGELGARMEVTIHSWMHMRWSASNSVGYRNSYRGTIPYIDKKWDTPSYDWLGDTYASHVNEVFYKLHGWIDDRIEDWRKANGLSSIKWKGTWTGGPMSNLGSVLKKETGTGSDDMGSMSMEVLDQAFEIFQKSGVPEVTFTDKMATGFLPDDTAPATTSPKGHLRKHKICKPKRSRPL